MTTRLIQIIAGPTAGGKSALALERARTCGGVIINCDSRQIYTDLPILTAQPNAEDREAAPHLLYGVLPPGETCSAGAWVSLAMPLIEECFTRGLVPIVTGGNGLYIKALMEGLSPIPSVPPDIRAAAILRQKELGNPAFHAALAARDPATAALYHPMHTARLIHAWEVLEATGRPLAEWQSMPKIAPPEDWMFDITLVLPPRDDLYARCDARFLQMLDQGAEQELADFDARVEQGDVPGDAVLIKTVGAPALRGLREGRLSRKEAITLAQTETRQYAKRQMTWFRNQIAPQKNIARIETRA